MKHHYAEMPETMKGTYGEFSKAFGFSWKEFVTAVPSPLFLVTSYKPNGLPNACMATIRNNQYEADEITASGLTVCQAEWVHAPMVQECFMNLECRYLWEKEIVPGDDHVTMCLEIVGAHIEDGHLADKTGENGLLYNLHHPLNPEKTQKTAHDYVCVLQKQIDAGEY